MTEEITKFLDLLTRRGLLSERVLAKLQRQVAEKGERGKTVPLEALANLLIEKGHLTRHQADSLVAESRQTKRDAESDLGLVPIDDEPAWGGSSVWSKGRPEPSLAETRAATDDLSEAQESALLTPIDAPPGLAPAEGPQPDSSDARKPFADQSLIDELPIETTGAQHRRTRRTSRTAARSEWDSPLLLIGGGTLLVLLLIGGLVWYLVRTDTGNAQLQAARQAYEDGAYSQAIQEYEQFLDAHAGHDEASGARVQLGLARIRRTLDSGAAHEDVLAQLQQVIAETEQEPAFGEAGRELAAILPEIAEGLAATASQAEHGDDAAELIAKTDEALALVTNTKYVPKSFRPLERIERIRNTLDSVQRRQERQKDLAAALGDIATALEKRDFQDAYRVHRRLIEKHPEAAQLDEVRSAAKRIAAAEAAAIEFREERRAASTEDRSDPDVQTVLLATTIQEGAGDGGAATAFVRIEGALYAMDAASGEVLWRRYVGIAPHLPPMATPDGDVLVIDVQHGEVARFSGRIGALQWRQEVGDVVANAALWSGTALIPTANGRLTFVDVATGETKGFVQFAQPLATAPLVDHQSGRIFVVGEHSSVYVLTPDARRGEDAIFVGHAAGNVSVPVVGYGQIVCVIENFAVDRARLHVFSATAVESDDAGDGDNGADGSAKESAWRSRMEPIRLTGRVTTPMATSGRRIAVATDLGELRVFDISAVAEGPPLSPTASRDAGDKTPFDRHLVLDESGLWLADARLTRLKVLAAGGRLQAQDLANVYNGDVFTHPLVVVGDRLIHVRRPQGRAGYLIAATDLQSGDSLWEAEVAVPPTDLSVLPEDGGIAVSLANGRIFHLDASELTLEPEARQRAASYVVAQDGVHSVDLLDEWAVATSVELDTDEVAAPAADELLLLPMNKLDAAPHALALPASLAARPSAFADALLVPLRIGQVLLVDPANGTSLAAPFQPPIDPLRLPEWTAAATVVPGESFAIADRNGAVYLVEIQRDPPRLVSVHRSEPIASPIVSEICTSSSSIFVATADRRLVVLRLPDLARASAIGLAEEIAWGPFAAADYVLFAAADNRLHCLSDDGGVITETSISARPVGRPLPLADQTLAVALGDGTLLRVDAATRSISTLGKLDQPVALGPVLLNDRLYAATPDEVLVSRPASAPARVATATISN